MQEPFTLNLPGRTISGILHLPPQKAPAAVITCHGLFSSRESDKFTAAAERFTRAGLAVIRFDFGGCGQSSGSIADTTVSGRLQELQAVVRFAAGHRALGGRFGILGSSLGGFVALFYASQNPVKALSLWATPFDLKEIARNVPEHQLKSLKAGFFSDAEKYDVQSLPGEVHTVQVIQGKRDTTVPWQHAQKIFACVGEPKQITLLPEADHSISAAADRAQALSLSQAWFEKHLA